MLVVKLDSRIFEVVHKIWKILSGAENYHIEEDFWENFPVEPNQLISSFLFSLLLCIFYTYFHEPNKSEIG